MPVTRASTAGSAVMLSIARYGSPPTARLHVPWSIVTVEGAQLLLDVPAEQPVAAQRERVARR